MTESGAGIRARREGWAREGRTTLTSRDIEILYIVGVCGVLRTADITRFFFGARSTANDRLRKLFCAGFLDAHAVDLMRDNYYTLTPRGREAVLDAHAIDADAVKVVRRLPKKLDHQLAVTEVRLAIGLALREHKTYALASFETDADLARERHASLLELIPDAKVVVRTIATGETLPWFLEMDLGTEPVTWLVRHKLAIYAKYAALGTALYGIQNPLVVLVVPGLRRARNIARALVDGRVGARVVIALRPTLDETTILAGTVYALPSTLAAASDADASRAFRERLLP